MDTVFFDRDGVINEVILRAGLVSSPRTLDEFRLRPDFVSAFQKISNLDISFFVVSNQPDVSRGLLSQATLAEMTESLQARFKFKEVVYCLHDNDQQCLCRKPKPGMLNYLVEKYAIERAKAIFIGDSAKDVLAGSAAGIRTIFLRQNYNQPSGCQPDFIVDSLAEILPIIDSV
ncbi:HAD-IIIA family hydrolase [bacterium]|nr:HAD-IIIA family hydrolase [bacterium]MBP9809087.1 HAD-IIIA family hydrolase [bacterium]